MKLTKHSSSKKAKGWNYILSGKKRLSDDQADSLRSAIKELKLISELNK